MQKELHDARMKIEDLEKDEEKYLAEQNKLFNKIEELENANTLLTEELEGAKDALEFKKK